MRYIDKFKKHKQAHNINVNFLKDCYQGNIKNPIPKVDSENSFDCFKQKKYRDGPNGWKALLLAEQTVFNSPRCCYCMRKLNPSSSKINYEHVIPQSLKATNGQKQFQYYVSHAPVLSKHIILAKDFAKKIFNTLPDIEQ